MNRFSLVFFSVFMGLFTTCLFAETVPSAKLPKCLVGVGKAEYAEKMPKKWCGMYMSEYAKYGKGGWIPESYPLMMLYPVGFEITIGECNSSQNYKNLMHVVISKDEELYYADYDDAPALHILFKRKGIEYIVSIFNDQDAVQEPIMYRGSKFTQRFSDDDE